MSNLQKYEINLKLYGGNEPDLNNFLDYYTKMHEEYLKDGSVMSKVTSYFFEGCIHLVQGDIYFFEKNYLKALEEYENSDRMFKRFQNSRNVRVRLDILAERLIYRSIGMIKLTKGLNNSNAETRDKLLVEALRNFNLEVDFANQLNEQMQSFAAFSRASFSHAMVLLYRALVIRDKNSAKAKKNLMDSRRAIRQASYINNKYLPYSDKISDELQIITKERLLKIAEEYSAIATHLSESGNYDEAAINFKKAKAFYNRASKIASDGQSRRFLLSTATVFEASIREVMAIKAYKRDNNYTEAIELYNEAGKYIDKAIALMGRFGNQMLINNFSIQRDYYYTMSDFIKAIVLFDNDEFEKAKDMFNKVKEIFEKINETSNDIDNVTLKNLSEEAISETKGYISMCINLM